MNEKISTNPAENEPIWAQFHGSTFDKKDEALQQLEPSSLPPETLAHIVVELRRSAMLLALSLEHELNTTHMQQDEALTTRLVQEIKDSYQNPIARGEKAPDLETVHANIDEISRQMRAGEQ